MEDRLPFKSGQPFEPHEHPNFGRTVADAARDAATTMRDKRNRNYTRKPTEAELTIDRRRHPWNYD